jgi:thioredoxin 1
MTTKKALIIAGLILGGLVVLVLVFAAAVGGFVFYSIGNSEAAQTAKTFLRSNAKLKQEIGEVRDFGFIVTGSVKTHGSAGNAELGLKTIGERKTVNATVALAYRSGREWRVVDAYYDGPDGERVYLTRNFEEGPAEGAAAPGDDAAGGGAGETGGGAAEGGAAEGGAAGNAGETGLAAPGEIAFDEEAFRANVIEAERPVLVFVGSPSSLDSKEVETALLALAPKYEQKIGLVRYEIDETPGVLYRLQVGGVPTLIVFKDGREQERKSGKLSGEQLSEMLDKYVGK